MKYKKSVMNYMYVSIVLTIFAALLVGFLAVNDSLLFTGQVVQSGEIPILPEITQDQNITNTTENITTPIDIVINETNSTPPLITQETNTTNQTLEIQSGCVIPYENMVINTSTTFCPGTYYLNDTDGNGAIRINSNNIQIFCNGTLIIGNSSGRGIMRSSGFTINNISITGCAIRNYSTDLLITLLQNSTLRNLDISSAKYEDIYIGASKNIIIDNVTLRDATASDDYSHGIYIDSLYKNATGNITLKNSFIYGNTNGIHINSANIENTKYIEIYNNYIHNNVVGLSDLSCEYCYVHNNIIYDNSGSGVRISYNGNNGQNWSARHSNFYSNTLYNNNVSDWQITEFTFNNTFSDNIYPDNEASFKIRIGNSSLQFYEYSTLWHKISFLDSPDSITYLYNGKKSLTLYNYSFTILDQASQFPYNDIKNASNGAILASNVDNYSITLSPGQQIIVGNFTAKSGPPITNYPPSVADISLSNTSSSLSCIADILDNSSMNVSVQYYLNNVLQYSNILRNQLSGTITDTINTSFYSNDVWYCRVRVFDGEYYSDWAYSNNIHIPYVDNRSIAVAFSSENFSTTANSFVLQYRAIDVYHNSFECSVSINNILNDTRTVYNNSLNNISITVPIGTYTWEVLCSDTLNNTGVLTSNFYVTAVPTSAPSSGGGGGGGGGYIQTEDTTNVTSVSNEVGSSQPSTPEIVPNVSNISSTNDKLSLNVIDQNINAPVFEEPKALQTIAKVTSKNRYIYYFAIIIFVILTVIVINKTRGIKVDNNLNKYIENALYAGYDYDAIRTSLKDKYKDSVIDEHFYTLKKQRLKPIIRHIKPITGKIPLNSKELVEQLKVYIRNQENQGFKKEDIKQALLHYGHHKKVVEEAINS